MTPAVPSGGGDIAVAMEGIVKTYGGVRALRDVSFAARRGEVHALLG